MNKKVVYLLEHYYEDEKHEDTKYIGVFSSKKKAEKVIKDLKTQPGFKSFPDGFCITEAVLNKSSWSEGFYYHKEDADWRREEGTNL